MVHTRQMPGRDGLSADTSSTRHAWVHEAVVDLAAGVDPQAVGAAVTVALCGHWEHEGPCRWPHNNEIVEGVFRTLFVCDLQDLDEVRSRIRAALSGAPDWQLVSDHERPVAPTERSLADNLLHVRRV